VIAPDGWTTDALGGCEEAQVNRRNRSILLGGALAIVPAALLAALMHRTQTAIDVPEPGRDVALSGLTYKGKAFEAKVSSVRLELKGGSDPLTGQWTFVGSNSDGQWHKVEPFVRLLDETGEQRAVFSQHCTLAAGARDQPCVVKMDVKAEIWKATKSIRIVTDWTS
jgi:hypothetical protein